VSKTIMSTTGPIPTITCPRCRQTLPALAQVCQFCHADLRGVARPVVPGVKSLPLADEPWKIAAYYVLGAYWILTGGLILLSSAPMLLASAAYSKTMTGGASVLSGFPLIGLIIGLIFVATGIGWLMKVELARRVVYVLAWLTIALAVLRIGLILLFGFIFGLGAILALLRVAVDIAFAVFQIYLIGETDSAV